VQFLRKIVIFVFIDIVLKAILDNLFSGGFEYHTFFSDYLGLNILHCFEI